jgi:uncharacterized iron-regulated membrane protein
MARNVYKNSLIRDVARFIAVSAGLLFGALLAVALVWGLIMMALRSMEAEEIDSSVERIPAQEENTSASPQQPSTAEEEPAVMIEVEELPEAQQKTLNAFGFEGETITISDTQMQCAEAAVGKERLAEIVSGATPGPIEAAKLFGCKDE